MTSPSVQPTATTVQPSPLPHLQKGDTIVLIGSCFADEMGKKLLALGENAVVNPMGILFNPISIAETLQRAIESVPPRRAQFVKRGERWVSFDCHSDLYGRAQDELEANIAKAQSVLQEGLSRARMVVVTFGTALLFQRQGEVVANCHRQPARVFSETMAPVEKIVEAWRQTLRAIVALNPHAQVVFTVSPVRHLLSGIHRNAVSKALLLQAAMQLAEEEKGCHYFPAFEIVLDELRDYRYFLSDLAHPSPLAVSIVAQRFWEAIGRTHEPIPLAELNTSSGFMPVLAPPRLVSYVEIPRMPQLDIASHVRCIGNSFARTLALLLSQCGLFALYVPCDDAAARTDDDAYTILCVEAQGASEPLQDSKSNTDHAFCKNLDLCAANAHILMVAPARVPALPRASSAYAFAKAILKAQCILKDNPNLTYFPAYEILHDELRDYRFYGDNLLTPAPTALQIITARLLRAIVDSDGLKTLQRYERLQQTLAHRPTDPHAPAYRELLQKLKAEAEALAPNLHSAVRAKLIF